MAEAKVVEPGEVTDLGDLQKMARENTRELNALMGRVVAERDPRARAGLEREVAGRRARGGALIQRRDQLSAAAARAEERTMDAEVLDLGKKLKVADLEVRAGQLAQELRRLADDAEQVARKATREEGGRDLARHLLGMARVCVAAQEAVRRVAGRPGTLEAFVKRAVAEGREMARERQV